jgi:hypothetical protein
MKNLIISIAIIFLTTSSIYSQTLKSVSLPENLLKTEETQYTSISFGPALSMHDSKPKLRLGINASLSHQFTKSFYLEGKFDFIPEINNKNSIFIFSVIPQWSVYNNSTLNFIIGPGIELIAINKEGGIILPLGMAKLHINITDNIFLSPELRFPPVLGSINFGFRIPYQGFK